MAPPIRNPYCALHKTIMARQPFRATAIAEVTKGSSQEHALLALVHFQGYNRYDVATDTLSVEAPTDGA